jgi:hypothetical protein
VVIMLLCSGCPGDPPSSNVDPETVPLLGSCAMADDLGGFSVSSATNGAGVEGSVADGVVPTSVLELLVDEGDCVLLRRNNPFCDPGCGPSDTCDFDGTCKPYPVNQDLGVVTIDGLANPVEMEAVFPGNTYFDTSLPQPPFTLGELVTLSMPGGAYGPVELHGVGLDPVASQVGLWEVEAGKDLVVPWSAALGGRSEIVLTVSIDQHGATPGLVRCVFADDGEGTVPASVVSALVESGVTGFPNGTLVRRTADKALVDGGCLDFVIASTVKVDVDVVGFTPCVGQQDCPEGLTCNLELQVCE